MSKVILYKPPYGHSARLIGAALGLSVCRRSSLTSAISWGAIAGEGLNHSIRLGKLFQLQAWKGAGLSSLKFSASTQPGWLARSGKSHGGLDFLPRETSTAFLPQYWTQPLKSAGEYRIHVCRLPNGRRGLPSDYQTIRLGWKTNEDPSLNRIVEGVPIRSRQYGWKLLYYSKQNFRNHLPQELDLLARWGLASIGWDFGALDVLKSNGRYVLVEVNSCPSLRDEATCSAYAEAFKEIMDGEE